MYAFFKTCSDRSTVALAALLLLGSCAAEDPIAASSPAAGSGSDTVVSDAGSEDKTSSTPALPADGAAKGEAAAAEGEAAAAEGEAAAAEGEAAAAEGEAAAAEGEAAAAEGAAATEEGAAATEEGAAATEEGAAATEEGAAAAVAVVAEAAAVEAAVPVNSEGEEPGKVTAGQVKKAIDSYVVKRTAEGGGLFEAVDDETGEALKLEFIGINDPVGFIQDDGYFACVSFRPTDDTVGKRYDVDLWVNVKGDKLVVTDMKVHKHPMKSGTTWTQQARYTIVGFDSVPD